MNRHVAIVVFVAVIASGCSQLRPISEAELLAYASAPVEMQVLVPVAISATLQGFCFPNVLAQNWSAYVR